MSASLRSNTRRFFGKAALLIGEPAWVLFCIFFAEAVVLGGVVMAIPKLQSAVDSTVGQLLVGALIYVLVLALVVLPVLMTRKKGYLARLVGVVKRPTREILWLPVLLWAAYMVATAIASYAAGFLPWVDSEKAQEIGFNDLQQPFEYVLVFIALVVLPSIAEELLFRGYLFGRLREKFGFWLTTAIVSIVFGAVHLQWNVGIDVALLSVFLCYLRERTGSVWASMVLHGIKNGLAYFLLFIAPLLGFSVR